MSPEIKGVDVYARVQKETPKPVIKRVDNYPKNWGSPANKRLSFTGVWRK